MATRRKSAPAATHPRHETMRRRLAFDIVDRLRAVAPHLTGETLIGILDAGDYGAVVWADAWRAARPDRKTPPSDETRALVVELLGHEAALTGHDIEAAEARVAAAEAAGETVGF